MIRRSASLVALAAIAALGAFGCSDGSDGDASDDDATATEEPSEQGDHEGGDAEGEAISEPVDFLGLSADEATAIVGFEVTSESAVGEGDARGGRCDLTPTSGDGFEISVAVFRDTEDSFTSFLERHTAEPAPSGAPLWTDPGSLGSRRGRLLVPVTGGLRQRLGLRERLSHPRDRRQHHRHPGSGDARGAGWRGGVAGLSPPHRIQACHDDRVVLAPATVVLAIATVVLATAAD